MHLAMICDTRPDVCLKRKYMLTDTQTVGFSNVVKGTCAISFFSSVLCFRIPLRATKACPGIRLVRQWDGHVVVTLRSGKGHYSRTQTMSRLVRLARSPCRLGTWFRKSVSLKNVSFNGQTTANDLPLSALRASSRRPLRGL